MEEFVDPRTFLKCSRSDFVFSCVEQLRSSLIVADWKFTPLKIDAGSSAQVFLAFDRSNPETRYIMKFIINPANGQDSIDKEVCLQNKAHQIGLAPKIVDAWICEQDKSKGIIIMKFLAGRTVFSFLDYISQKVVSIQLTMQLYRIMFKIFVKAYELNEAGIFHHDLNLGNVLVDIEDDEVTDVQFIDFGLADTKETIFDKVLSLNQADSATKMADAVSNAFKEMNVDRILPLEFLIDYSRSQQAKTSVNKHFLTILRRVIRTFYDDFLLPRLSQLKESKWSEYDFDTYVESLSTLIEEDITELIDEENYDLDAEEFVSQILGD